MGKTILIGNGLNRCYSNDVSTENIIFSLEKELLKKESELIKLNNFSLVFESIINGKYNFDIKEYFNFICDKLKILNKINNDIYMLNKDLLLSFDSIVTTNYDYSIEYNLFGDSNIKTQAVGRNKGYVYTSNENNKKIYHIHGDLNHKKNLCLGFYGYQKYVKSCYSNLKQDISKYKSETAILDIKNNLPKSLRCFLENDIYIVGLSLHDSEALLWYILTIRKEAIRLNCFKKINKIYFYIPNDMRIKKGYEEYLNNYSIELCQINLINEDYIGFYKKVFDSIRKNIKNQ